MGWFIMKLTCLLSYCLGAVLETELDLSAFRSENHAVDYLLLRGGKNCLRCDDIERAINSIPINIPLLVSKYDRNEMPLLELHSWKETGYVEIPYKGQLTVGSILTFIQKAYGQDLTKCESMEDCLSKVSKGEIPFVGVFPDEQNGKLDLLHKAITLLRREQAKAVRYLYFIDPNFKDKSSGQLTVNHANEMRLATRITTLEDLVTWIRKEQEPMFGSLSESSKANSGKQCRVYLVGDEETFKLYQYELRHFAMHHRNRCHRGYVPRHATELLRQLLDVEQQEDIEEIVNTGCGLECVVLKVGPLINFVTNNISSEMVAKEVDDMHDTWSKMKRSTSSGTGTNDDHIHGRGGDSKAETRNSEPRVGETAPVPDLSVEHDKIRSGALKKVDIGSFRRDVVLDPGAILLLQYDPEDEVSQQLRVTFLDVVASLSREVMNLKYYEMAELPPPDSRYVPPSLPFIWFKPFGPNAEPIEIPWATDNQEEPRQTELITEFVVHKLTARNLVYHVVSRTIINLAKSWREVGRLGHEFKTYIKSVIKSKLRQLLAG